MSRRIRRYLSDVGRAFRRAPAEVLLALTVAGSFSAMLATDPPDRPRGWMEITVATALAAAVAWTGTLLTALGKWSARRRWAVTAAGLAAAVAYGLTTLRFELGAERWRAAALLATAALWLAFVPVLARSMGGDATLRFRRVGGRIVLRTIAASLYGAGLFAGLALAIAAVGSLFELELPNDIYGHVFGWIAFALVPWVVVGGVEEYARPLDRDGAATDVVHRIAAYLVVPLVVIYYAILYAYAVRIAALGEMPENLLSPLSIAAGALTTLALVLFTDRTADDRAGHRVLRLLPPLFVPLGILGIRAIGLRVEQYGWTEFRYLRIALLAGFLGLALAGTVRALRRRPLPVHLAPLVLAGVLALSAVGPWGATAVSRRSQQARLRDALETAGILQDGRLRSDPTPARAEGRTVPNEVYEQITSTARYLHDHFGRDAVLAVAPLDELGDAALHNLAAELGLRREAPVEPGLPYFAHLAPGEPVTGVRSGVLYRITVPVEPPPGPGAEADDRAEALPVETDSTTLRIRVAGLEFHAELDDIVRAALTTEPARGGRIPTDRAGVTARDTAGAARGGRVVLESGVGGRGGSFRIHGLDAVLALPPGTGPDAPGRD